jgi:uncharacterized Zn-finger protein
MSSVVRVRFPRAGGAESRRASKEGNPAVDHPIVGRQVEAISCHGPDAPGMVVQGHPQTIVDRILRGVRFNGMAAEDFQPAMGVPATGWESLRFLRPTLGS